ncbi:MAG: sugar transferase, partial [Planctomycetes bacterium]|nr:sugar transferase [Planctomycetota bacterium]
MNILYLAHRIPYPPDKGDKIRSFRQLEHLAQQHDVWCACFMDTPADEQYVEPLSAFCREVAAVRINRTRAKLRGIAGLIHGKTITESFYTDAAMGDLLREWAASVSFDAVVAYSSGMAPYALMVPAQRRVLDLCDVDSRKWLDYAARSRGPMRWVYKTEGHRLADVERTWIDAFNAAILITKAEVEALDSRAPREKIHVVGNGVDLPDLADPSRDYLSSEGSQAEGSSDDLGPRPAGNPIVGFVGALDYYPNIDGVV